jgi:hypothetical protein
VSISKTETFRTKIGTPGSENRSIQFAHASTTASLSSLQRYDQTSTSSRSVFDESKSTASLSSLQRYDQTSSSRSVFDESKLALADTMARCDCGKGKSNRKAANQ